MMKQRIAHARACIADAERPENSLSTRVDAAVQAIAFLDKHELQSSNAKWFITEKYFRVFDEDELRLLHKRFLAVAKILLSKEERQ